MLRATLFGWEGLGYLTWTFFNEFRDNERNFSV